MKIVLSCSFTKYHNQLSHLIRLGFVGGQSTVKIGCSGKHAHHQHNGLVPHLVAKLQYLEDLHYQVLELAMGQ
jgi:hypothetical protein